MTDAEVLVQLIELQKIDSAVLAVENEKRDLKNKVTEFTARIDANTAEFNSKKSTLNEARKKRALIEVEIKTKEGEVKSKEDQTSQVKTNEAFKALQNEIDSIKAGIRKLEDDIIKIMEEEETANSWVKTQEKAMKEEETKLLSEIKALETEAGGKDALIAAEMAKRGSQVKNVDKLWYDRYEKIRKNKNGLAIARIIEDGKGNGVCGGCKFSVRAQAIIELKKGGSIKLCENCARILYSEKKEGVVK